MHLESVQNQAYRIIFGDVKKVYAWLVSTYAGEGDVSFLSRTIATVRPWTIVGHNLHIISDLHAESGEFLDDCSSGGGGGGGRRRSR